MLQGDKNDGEKDIKRLPLQIGAAICGTTGSRIGTLGGFVILPNGQIGLITCAHVVGTETGSVVSLVRDKNQQAKRYVQSEFNTSLFLSRHIIPLTLCM